MKQLYTQAQEARNCVVTELKQHLPDTFVHGVEKNAKEVKGSDWKKIAPHLLYISFSHTNHAYLATLLDTKGFSVSTGSACDDTSEGSLRVSVLPTTTKYAARVLVRCMQGQLPLARNI